MPTHSFVYFSLEYLIWFRWASFSASIQSELLMIIRKQLCHTRIEFQRMGVIGSVALVHSLADPELVGDTNQEMRLDETLSSITISSASGDILTGTERLKQAKKVIDLVHGCTKRVPEVAALFMDEMASSLLFHDLHPMLQSYLYETVAESFQVMILFFKRNKKKCFHFFPFKNKIYLGLFF